MPGQDLNRRFPLRPPRVVGRAWPDCSREVQEFLDSLFDSNSGVPGGFKDLTPVTVTIGGVSSPGAEASGWMASDAVLTVQAPTASSGLSNANATGSSSAGAREDHTHKRDIRVRQNGADVATRNALNFMVPAGTVTDDPGNDEVDVNLGALLSSLLSGGGIPTGMAADGQDGADGPPGRDGAAGVAGVEGPPGALGPPGLDGVDGEPGYWGPPGERGVAGPTGAAGGDGAQGSPGFPGSDGDDGVMGAPGPTGLQGEAGLQGSQGPPGQDSAGEDGSWGPPGDRGLTGAAGADGVVGVPGLDGRDGDDGTFGLLNLNPFYDPPQGAYAPGSFLIADGRFALMGDELQLTGDQRLELQGTGRLIVMD